MEKVNEAMQRELDALSKMSQDDLVLALYKARRELIEDQTVIAAASTLLDKAEIGMGDSWIVKECYLDALEAALNAMGKTDGH